MAQYIVELGDNRFIADTLKSAIKKAVNLAETGYRIKIWQIVKNRISHIGSVVVCKPDHYYKNKMRSITVYFKNGVYGLEPVEIYPAHKDGSLGSKIDILNIKWYPYFPHTLYNNDRMSDADKRKDAVRTAFYHHVRR